MSQFPIRNHYRVNPHIHFASLRNRTKSQNVWRRSCCVGGWQWIRHVQGRFRRWRRSPRRLPLHRRSSPLPGERWNHLLLLLPNTNLTNQSFYFFPIRKGHHGRHGPERFVRRRWSPVQAWYPDREVPHRTRYRHQLGWHGEDLAPHLLQWAPRRPRGTPRPPDRGSPQP